MLNVKYASVPSIEQIRHLFPDEPFHFGFRKGHT